MESQTPADRTSWVKRALALDLLIGLFVVAAVLVALLPFMALVRGLVVALRLGYQGAETLGIGLSLVALSAGSIFFLYSLKYYLATLAMLVSSLVLANGNGRTNGNRNASGHAHPHGLMRFLRRGNGNGHRNGNGSGHLDLGYEPFVSIHIATYNEKRVIARLLEACAGLNYANYEVIVVDDSTDGTAEILGRWEGIERFKVIRRAGRDGFKGGALMHALRAMDPRAEYVVIFDADAVPFPDVIHDFLYHFYSNGIRPPRPIAEVGAVQSYQWHVLNK